MWLPLQHQLHQSAEHHKQPVLLRLVLVPPFQQALRLPCKCAAAAVAFGFLLSSNGSKSALHIICCCCRRCHFSPQMEYHMAVRQVAHEDFLEGVRAALVDKDRHPAWLKPAAAAAGAVQQEQQLALSERQPEAAVAERQLPGNRFSVQHLFAPL